MLSKLTLITLHNQSNGAIWGDIDDYIPVGVNKEILINEILKEDGEFSLIYPDPEFLRVQIRMFFMKYQQMFTKWINVLNEEYDPLFNVDVKTDYSEEGSNSEDSASSCETKLSILLSYNDLTFLSSCSYPSSFRKHNLWHRSAHQ